MPKYVTILHSFGNLLRVEPFAALPNYHPEHLGGRSKGSAKAHSKTAFCGCCVMTFPVAFRTRNLYSYTYNDIPLQLYR
jgi:hypothetical protein